MSSKSNVMSPVQLNASVHRDGFDLSRKVCFTAKFGQLLPVLNRSMYPGDKFRINLQEFTRTLPVNTAAFARMRHYFDFYFVPYNLLWRDFPSFQTSMSATAKQATSIDDTRKVGDVTPYFTSQQLRQITNVNVASSLTKPDSSTGLQSNTFDPFGFNRFGNARRLLGYLGYYHVAQPSASGGPQNVDNVQLSPFPLLAYQKIYNDYFRYSQWEDESANSYNIDYLQSGEQIPTMDLLDFNGSTGTADSIPTSFKSANPNMFDLRYANMNKDLFLGILPSRQYGVESTVKVNIDASEDQYRTGFGLSFIGSTAVTPGSTTMGLSNPSGDGKVWTSVGPTGLNSDARMGTVPSFTPNIDLGKNFYGHSDSPNTLIHGLQRGLSLTMSVLQLRAAEAVQRFKEIALSNKQDYKSQIESQFGVKVSKLTSGLCEYIGGIAHDISVNEVVNQTFDGTSGSVGQQAYLRGKGIGSGDGYVEYECRNHAGVFMCIYHAAILPDYTVQGYEKDNMRTSFSDFPNPAFDRLGNEPIPQVLLTGKTDGVPLSSAPERDYPYVPLGYGPRYYDLKTSYDILLGGFNSFQGGHLNPWVTPIDPKQLLPKMPLPGYIPPVASFGYVPNFWSFKLDPSLINPLFVVQSDNTLDSDPLMITAFFDFKAVRNFDRSGMPY